MPMSDLCYCICRQDIITYVIEGVAGKGDAAGKLSVPGLSNDMDNYRTSAYCAYSRLRWDLFGFFFLYFFLPSLSYRMEILSQRAV